MTVSDLLLPFFKIKGRGLNFNQFNFFGKGAPSQYKNLIEPPRNRSGYIVQWHNYVEDALILEKEKAIKNYFDPTNRLNLLQESYLGSQLAG